MHGGMSLSGINAPAFKDGRYSKYIPTRMLERYNEAIADPELLAQRHEVALIDARLGDLLKRADEADPSKALEQARLYNIEIQKAVHDENYGRMLVMALQLDGVLNDAQDDHHVWDEVQSLIEQRRKVVESERKRLVEMQQMVSTEKALTLVTALLAAVKENVPDRQALTAIQVTFNRLVTAEASA
jgi:hypothetical protein